ncbi:MAG: Ig-like domain-containing protein [Bacteroidales bacterium]|nr:Ig-like domain-containing protein [Bacteroidales bacterium]
MLSLNRNISILIILFLIIASCAKVSSPSGGPQDEQPPEVLSIIPENESVNFEGRSFEVTFDEYFILDNVDQVLMISPPLNEKPEIKTRGKKLIVELDEDEVLHDSVTYSFNFLDCIKDLNENNPLENFKYVFSTGDIIDSLSITGCIYDAFSLEAGEEILVLLHSEMADTIPQTSLPDYITRASDNGKFRIDNIAAGEYKIYGLKDDNNNKQYDLPTEAFSFLDSSIYVSAANNYIPARPDSIIAETDSTLLTPVQDTTRVEESGEETEEYDSLRYERIPGKEYELYYFVAENKIQYLTGTDRPQPYLLQFKFSLPVDTTSFIMQFADTVGEVQYLREISAKQDTFRIWLTDSAFYSRERITVYLEHPETDTLGQLQSVIDTINFRYRIITRGRQPAVEEISLPFRTNLSQSTGLKPEQKPEFVFETPVWDPDTSLIKLFLKSDTLLINRKYSINRDSLNSKKFLVEAELVPDSSYLFIMDKGAFRNIYNHLTDSGAFNFRIRSPEQFGRLTLNITGFVGDVIVQLMDPGEKLVRQKKISLPDEGSIDFTYLDSKDYLVKLIFDIDRNGEWTTGDYQLKRQPEPVTYYPGKIGVKAGWELIEDWQIEGLRQKVVSISTTRGENEKK